MNANLSVKGACLPARQGFATGGGKYLAIFFQVLTAAVGIGVFVFMLWEPHLEGVNANAATFSDIYLDDPFLAYMYAASLAFFAGLYNAFKAFGYVRENKVFTGQTLKALRAIKFSAIIFIVFILGAEAYLVTVQRGKEDDIAGGIAMGIFIIFVSALTAGLAGKFERTVQKAIIRVNN